MAISGATSAVYTTPVVDLTYNGAKYYAAVTDSCAGTPLNSTQATLTVTAANVPPTIITQPIGLDVPVASTTAAFTVVATGSGTLTYQWYRIPAGQSVGSAVGGATSATYTLPATATAVGNDQDEYYVIVSNAYGQAISSKVTLAVGAGILITQQPETAYVNVGDTATYTVAATSLLPLTYQWYSAPAGSSTFTAISGATNPTLTVSSAGADGQRDRLQGGGEQRNVGERDEQHGGVVCRAAGTSAGFVRHELGRGGKRDRAVGLQISAHGVDGTVSTAKSCGRRWWRPTTSC